MERGKNEKKENMYKKTKVKMQAGNATLLVKNFIRVKTRDWMCVL